MSTRPADVGVIGGGVVGLGVALAAARRGLRVVIVDRRQTGAASRAAAGMLAPMMEGLGPDVLPAGLAARDHFPAFLAGLERLTGVSVPLDRNGILKLASTEAELYATKVPAGAERLDAGALARLEPTLAGHAGAVLHDGDGSVDHVLLMDALERAVEGDERIARVDDLAAAVEIGDAGGAIVCGGGDRVHASHLVVTAGAWAGGLTGLPRALPVRPMRGQALSLASRALGHVTYGGGGYLVPRGDRTVVGATSEDVGFDSAITPSGRDTLLAIAGRVSPEVSRAAVLDHWAGLRPMSPDGIPVVGPDPDHPSLLYACGMSRNGILFGPWIGEQVAALLVDEARNPLLDPFGVGRFEGSALRRPSGTGQAIT